MLKMQGSKNPLPGRPKAMKRRETLVFTPSRGGQAGKSGTATSKPAIAATENPHISHFGKEFRHFGIYPGLRLSDPFFSRLL